MLKIVIHPTHRRKTTIGLFTLAIIGILFGGLASQFSEGDILHRLGLGGFVLCMILFIVFLIIQLNTLVCFTCKKRLHDWGKASLNEDKLFKCSTCNVIWNSRIGDNYEG